MTKKSTLRFILSTTFLFGNIALAQSLEYYAGDKRTGVDLMWFKNFKSSDGKNTPFLFFSRNRASVDYHNSLTVFGSTNAVSYNFKNGLGLVSVASFLNNGFTPKAGLQYFKAKKEFLFFGWLVTDIKNKGGIDCFGLFRYQPKISEKWQLFSQLELFPIYNPSTEIWNTTERIRLGIKYNQLAFGLMLDGNQNGKTNWTTTENSGVFVRYDFK